MESLGRDDPLGPGVTVVRRDGQPQVHRASVGLVDPTVTATGVGRVVGEDACVKALDVEVKDRPGLGVDHVGGVRETEAAAPIGVPLSKDGLALPGLAVVGGAALDDPVGVRGVSATGPAIKWTAVVGGEQATVRRHGDRGDTNVVSPFSRDRQGHGLAHTCLQRGVGVRARERTGLVELAGTTDLDLFTQRRLSNQDAALVPGAGGDSPGHARREAASLEVGSRDGVRGEEALIRASCLHHRPAAVADVVQVGAAHEQ